jgi:hypothetical protein
MTTFCLHPQQNQQWQIFDTFTMKSLTRYSASLPLRPCFLPILLLIVPPLRVVLGR